MKRYYCTYFDKNYLFRAIALIESLNKHERCDFQLFAVCMDEITRVVLEKLNLPNVITVPIHEIEQGKPELTATKKDRSLAEYYWTAGPTIILHLLERNPQIDVLTYLDADLLFFSSPDPVFDELGNNSVLIHEHRFPSSMMNMQRYGKFNVGLMCFRNDGFGLNALRWWQERCIEWCYNRIEGDKYADQKYLDDWPQRFEGVGILRHVGSGLAPWNYIQYQYDKNKDGNILVDGAPLVFYHFHELRFVNQDIIVPFATYPFSIEFFRSCYLQYIYLLFRAIDTIRTVVPDFEFGLNDGVTSSNGGFFFARSRISGKISPSISLVTKKLDDNWDCYCLEGLTERQKRESSNSDKVQNPVVSCNKSTIATSITPQNIERQMAAIKSWIKLGFDVVSINCGEEIDILEKSFPEVRFVKAERDGRELFGKPVIYFDDFLEYFDSIDSEFCGIVNSDIFLKGDTGIVDHIREQASDSLVYSSRIEVESLKSLDGEVLENGFDFFFFPKSVIRHFPKSVFCLGMPWWDYWVPLILALEGVQIKKLVSPFAYHITHSANWGSKHWGMLAKKCFGYLREKLDENFHLDTDSNPWAFLSRMILTYHYSDLKAKGLTDKTKMSIGIIYPCIFDFLKTKSIQISYAGDKLKGLDALKEKRDIYVHDDESPIDRGNYLHAECEVSIVLCTRNRAEMLDQMLGSLKEAKAGVSMEIIVVDGDSTDDTLAILCKHHVTRVYRESECLGTGRHSWPQLYNFGFSKATGKWAMYASDDILFNKGCISSAVRCLEQQKDNVAGGIFFYKNAFPTNPEWKDYGVDFTHGQKLIMNYGLVQLEDFKQVGGLDEAYQFYCADTDFCYKLYENGKQLIPLSESLILHNNVLDAQKKANFIASDRDIELLLRRWSHFVPSEIPNPRRLPWSKELFKAFSLPGDLEKIDCGIEKFWHGVAYFHYGQFEQAKEQFGEVVKTCCDHWYVWWCLAQSTYKCGDMKLAEKFATKVIEMKPDAAEANMLLSRLGCKTGGQAKKASEFLLDAVK